MVERITSQKLLESETRQKSREVKDTQTLRMWCVEQAVILCGKSVPIAGGGELHFTDPLVLARGIENYILGRVVSS